MNFLVHHQCFKNKKATEFALKSFKEHNPDAPYILWSDAGEDYTELADTYDIGYFYSNINVGYRYYNKDKAYELFDRVRKSCELYPNLPYVIWMEDDVLVKGKIEIPDDVDFCGGPDVGNRYLGNAYEYLCEKYKLTPNFDYYCTAGGTIMSSEVFTDSFNMIEKFLDEDYDHIVNNLWTELAHHDIMIMTCHLICNKKYSINPQHVELSRSLNWNDDKFTIVHGYKNHY